MKIGKKTLAIVATLIIVAVVSVGFAAVLFTRTLTATFTVSHGNLLIYSDSAMTTPITTWTIGAVSIFGDAAVQETITVYIKNTGPSGTIMRWNVAGLDPALTLAVAYNGNANSWPTATALAMDHNQVRDVTLTLTIPSTFADGPSGFTFNIDVANS